jgi:DeoR family transcriptional regulator of aga operon
MIRIQRQAKVLQLLREREFVENSELARIFGVTLTTIRRDLKTLAEQGVINLDHGGAAWANNGHIIDEPLYETKVFVNREAKQSIGAAAAALVQHGEAIILDSGTTNAAIARSLRTARPKDLTVITCDLMVAKELGAEQHIDVIVLGGLLRKSYYSTYGAYAEMILRNLHAVKFFLGVDAADMEHGITNIVLEEAAIKRLQMEISEQVILVADSGKFGKTALHRVCAWDAIDQIITDDCLNSEYTAFFAERNIPVLKVNPCGQPI